MSKRTETPCDACDGMEHDRLVAENEKLRAALERINRDIYTALLYRRIYKGVAEDMGETIEQALKGE